MAVSALELRPRGPIALFDAAIHLSARSSGLWALTLPGGVAVTAAALHLFDAALHHRGVLWPSVLFTSAWLARGLCQGAACHYLERLLVGADEPTVKASFAAALKRLPSLIVTVGYLAVFSLVVPVLTLGVYYLVVGSHVVGYAVAMQGKGHPLGLYATCAKALGPTRGAAVWVRALFVVQALVVFNLHVAANVALYLGQKVLALDVTFAERFASVDNAPWVLAVIALGFALFEPLRAATSTLLLVDGRVRQEGLDLVAAVEQLPRRHPTAASRARMAGILVLALAVTLARPAEAAEPIDAAQAKGRLSEAAGRCGLSGPKLAKQLDAVDGLTRREQSALARFLDDVEAAADDDCEAAKALLERGLPLIVQTRDALSARRDAQGARERAGHILARPEFTPDPEAVAPPAGAPDEPKVPPTWWTRFKDWLDGLSRDFWSWLKKLLDQKPTPSPDPVRVRTGGAEAANVLVVVLVIGVLAVLAALLLKARRRPVAGASELEVQTSVEGPLAADPQSALSRPPEGWASLADEFAAVGNFREAVRSLYLALLSRLHGSGAIDYDPARSNWDYVRAFKGQPQWKPRFRELTHRFDFTYYGNLGATADGYKTFRSLTRPMLSPHAAAAVPSEPGNA